jgi:hypothetical protein
VLRERLSALTLIVFVGKVALLSVPEVCSDVVGKLAGLDVEYLPHERAEELWW